LMILKVQKMTKVRQIGGRMSRLVSAGREARAMQEVEESEATECK
jgi:hypothetical protein